MWHKLILVGRLTKDAEPMRHTPQGKPVVNFSVAVDDGYGENKKTIYYRVSVWEKTAEACANLKKGAMVLCETKMLHENGSPRVYKKSDGSYSASFEVDASNVRFLSGKGESAPEDDLF